MATTTDDLEPVAVLTTLADAKDALRQKDLRQCLYDAGDVVMNGVLVNLHGDDHRARRRLENRLFRKDVLVHYEHDLFPGVIDETLCPHLAEGRAELVSLGHQLMMNLAALNAGVDRPTKTPEETFRLYRYMMKFIEGATLSHSLGDRERLRVEIADALESFDREFLRPSVERRLAALEGIAGGHGSPEDLPRDVLTTILENRDNLHLSDDVRLREIAFFLLAGAHTSAMSFTRTLHHIFEWVREHPGDEAQIHQDRAFVQRCVLESVRLFPSSPVAMRRALADVTLRDGTVVPEGRKVVIDLMAVNRDPSAFGPDADRFDPRRQIDPEVAAPFGLSFGHGMHACIGQELATGVWRSFDDVAEQEQFGLVSVAVQAMIDAGARPDPDDPPAMDSSTLRPYWARYPVLFSTPATGRSPGEAVVGATA